MKSFNQFVKSRDVKISEMAAPKYKDPIEQGKIFIFNKLTSLKKYLEENFDDQHSNRLFIVDAPQNWMLRIKNQFEETLKMLHDNFDIYFRRERPFELTDNDLSDQDRRLSMAKDQFQKLINILVTTKKIGDTEHKYGSKEHPAASPFEADDAYNRLHPTVRDDRTLTKKRSEENLEHWKEMNAFINKPYEDLINKIDMLLPHYAPEEYINYDYNA